MDPILQELRLLLEEKGLQAILKFLNGRAPHRYTGIFRFDPPELRNLALADAWDSNAKVMDAAPIDETFCGLVRTTEAPFMTADGRSDARLTGHILAKNAVQSYCGVILRGADGRPFGSLCHFDTRPCDIGHQAIELLESAAMLIHEANLLEKTTSSQI